MSHSRLSELCGQLLSHQTPRLDPHECTEILLKKVDSLQFGRIRTHCITIENRTVGSIFYGITFGWHCTAYDHRSICGMTDSSIA